MCTRGWYASVLPLLMFWEKFLMTGVLAANLMLTELLFFPAIIYLFRMKVVRFIIFKFLSSTSHSHVCLVIVPNWKSSLFSIGNNITRYAYDRFFHLMTILSAVCGFNVGYRTFASYWYRAVTRKSSLGLFYDVMVFSQPCYDCGRAQICRTALARELSAFSNVREEIC